MTRTGGAGTWLPLPNDTTRLLTHLAIGAAPNNWDDIWLDFDVIVSLIYPGPTGRTSVLVVWPIEDGPLPDFDQLDAIVRFTTQAVSSGKRTLVASRAGLNRSGLVAALVVRQLSGYDGFVAAGFVRLRRRGAIRNPTFAEFLSGLPELAGIRAARMMGIEPLY